MSAACPVHNRAQIPYPSHSIISSVKEQEQQFYPKKPPAAMERFVTKVKKPFSRLKNDKSTPSVPASPPVDPSVPTVETQHAARQENPVPLDPTGAPQRIWNQAYDELKEPENEQAIVEAYEQILSTYLPPTTQDSNVRENLIDGDPAKRWEQMKQLVQKGLEKTVKDADRKEKVNHWFTIVQPLRDAVSTGVKAAPAAAIPWAGICCALQLLSSPLTEPKKNRDGMTYVLSRMQWYWELWRLILDENLSSSPTRPLQTELEKQVTKLYRKLLLFQMKSVITYHRGRFAVFFRDLPKLDDWATLVSEIKDAEIAVTRDCEQYSTLEIRTSLQGILSSADEQAKQMADIFRQNETHHAWEREVRHKEKDDNCLRDLHKTDPRHDKRSIISAKGGLLYDSYHWVTENQQYKQWYEERNNRLLWIKGDSSAPNGVFYFFCQASDPSLRSAVYVLRGLIWSLVRTRPSLISHVRQQYDQAGADIFVNHNAWQALSEMFTAILNDDDATDCVFVVDALDECTKGQEKLIDLISRLSNTCKARWLISSRNWQTIEGQLHSVTGDARLQLELNATAISEAVNYFINHKVKELARGKRLNDDIRVKLYEYLVANADDTFLWVALVCEELAKLGVAARHILEVAYSFPSGLTELYERMMATMNQSRDKEFCEAVLALSAVAIRPLTILEIATLDRRLNAVSEDLEAITDIVRSCGSFLIIREDTVHIVHQSARDYLIEASDSFPSGIAQQHYEIFASSLNTMHKKLHRNMYQLNSTVMIDEIKPPEHRPLDRMQYACIHWANHFDTWYSAESRNTDLEDSAYGLLLMFFTTKCLYWFEAMSLLRRVSDVTRTIQKLEELIQSGPQELQDLIEDAGRWILSHRSIIDAAPMQLYTSALLFSPQQSKIRQCFATEAPSSIETLCPSFQEWDTCLQTITGLLPCDLSPDRTKLVTITEDDATILILDALTGNRLQSLRADAGGKVRSVSYHPDGRHLASVSNRHEIMIWDIYDQECVQCFFVHARARKNLVELNYFEETRLRFSTNGRFLATSFLTDIEVWNVQEKASLHCLYNDLPYIDGHMEWADWGVDRSNIQLLLVIRSIGDEVPLQIDAWKSETGQHLARGAQIDGLFWAAAVAPDGRQLALATNEGVSIVQWDTDFGIRKVIDKCLIRGVINIAWSADGKILAMAAGMSTILWDLERQAEVARLNEAQTRVWMLRGGNDNRLASTDDWTRETRIWKVELSSDLSTSVKERNGSRPRKLEQGPNENLAVYKNNRDIEVLNVLTGTTQHIISCSMSEHHTFRFGPEHYFAGLSKPGIIDIWDLASGDRINRFHIYDGDSGPVGAHLWPVAMAFGPSSSIVYIGSELKIWNLVSGTSRVIPHSLRIAYRRYIACSSDGRLAFNWIDDEVAVWGCDWTKERQHLIETTNMIGLSFNANGLLMIQCLRAIQVWNCEDGTMLRTLDILGTLSSMCWDPRYQLGLDTRFGIIDLDIEKEGSGIESEGDAELPWCPRSLRLDGTESSTWLMKGNKRILWIPRASVNLDLFSVRTDLETGMSTVALVHSNHVMILRIADESL
ncbi:hypothetical protein ACHAQI_005070 [Fusarium lateritium]